MLTRLLMIARLIRLLMIAITRTIVALTVVTLERRLLLNGDEARFLAEAGRKTILFLALFRRCIGIGAGLRLILAELLLSRRNQAEVVFGVLIVVFRRNRIAGGARI